LTYSILDCQLRQCLLAIDVIRLYLLEIKPLSTNKLPGTALALIQLLPSLMTILYYIGGVEYIQ